MSMASVTNIRYVKEQLVIDFELLNWNPSYPQKILIMILFVADIVDEYGHKYRIGALWKSNMILSLSSLRQLEARSGRSFKAERIKSTGSSKCLQSSLGNMILCLGKHVDRNLQSKIKKYCGTTSQSTNNSTGDNTCLLGLEFPILNFLVGSEVEAVAFLVLV